MTDLRSREGELMPGRLDGKVCVITGAASGIGAESARLFASEGARVVGVDLAEGAEGELALQADVSSEDDVREMYARTAEEMGRIDVLFNNAGINPTDDSSVLDTELDAWQRVQDVNTKSVFLCCKHGIPHLLEAGGGSVINTASFVAVMGAAVSQISYTASKGAVLAMSREMGVEFADRGVRVNALCPGPVNTPLLQELFAKDKKKAGRRLVHLPMGFGEATDIANGALFLASDDSRYVNASTFMVDGGLSGAYVTPGAGGLAPDRDSDADGDRVQEAAAERAADLVPGGDAAVGLGSERLVVEADPDRVLVRAPVVDPVVRVRGADFGVELDAPGRLADAVCLDAPRALRQHHRFRGREALVAVPVEAGEAGRHRLDQGIVGTLGRHLDFGPADLGVGHLANLAADGEAEDLGAEAGSEQRGAALDQLGEQQLLEPQPGMVRLLVGVHGAAERHHRVVFPRIGGRLPLIGDVPVVEPDAPLADRLGEDAGPRVVLMDQRQDSHRPAG